MKQSLTLVFAAFLAANSQAQAQDSSTVPDSTPELIPGVTLEQPPATIAEDEKEVIVVIDAQDPVPFGPMAAADVSLDDLKWLKRPIVVFADTPADPRFQEQMELLLARPDELIKRDVVLIVDTDPRANSAIRTKLRPRGFMLTLVGKDGGVKLRKPSPWDVREITRSIDKMPLRKQEIRENKALTAP